MSSSANSASSPPAQTSQMIKLVLLAAIVGAVVSLLTAAYLIIAELGTTFFEHPIAGLSIGMFWPLILLVIGGLAVGLIARYAGEHLQLGSTQREYAESKGRLNYRHLPSNLLQIFVSLWSGSSVGPEAGIAELGGGAGSWIANRLKLKINAVSFLTYCGIAGSFGAFFGNPITGAFVAMEYLFITGIPYVLLLIPGLVAATVGYLVYSQLLDLSASGIFAFPPYPTPTFVDVGWALLIGIIAGLFAAYHRWLFSKIQGVFARFKNSPIKRGLIGGVVVGLVGSFIPLVLYSGQKQMDTILFGGVLYGVGFLILLAFVKSFVMAVSFNSIFKGGPIFPYLFMGGTLGLAVSQLLPIPEGVAVTCGMAAVTGGLFPVPISIIIFVTLMSQINFLPTIIIATITSFLLSRLLTPSSSPAPIEHVLGKIEEFLRL
jgi:H+/Cl- antiporter ClcA